MFRPSALASSGLRTTLADCVLDSPARELRAAAQAGLLADPRQVVLHRARRDEQLLADLVVGLALDHEPQDVELAPLQRADGRLLAACRAGELLEQVTRERGRDDRTAAMGGDDCLAQLLACAALREVAGGA